MSAEMPQHHPWHVAFWRPAGWRVVRYRLDGLLDELATRDRRRRRWFKSRESACRAADKLNRQAAVA
jgi:hypothetical protein